MSAQHTPGPWIVRQNRDCSLDFFGESGRMAFLCNARLTNQDANARLIAAAPEMLEALKDAYPYIADNALRERVGNLIANATGVQA
jgi:hypothetical protein